MDKKSKKRAFFLPPKRESSQVATVIDSPINEADNTKQEPSGWAMLFDLSGFVWGISDLSTVLKGVKCIVAELKKRILGKNNSNSPE